MDLSPLSGKYPRNRVSSSRLFSAVLGLAVLGALLYLAYAIVGEAIRLFSSLDKTVEASIIAAGATVIVSVITISFGNYWSFQLQVKKEHRDKKIPVYEDLLSFMSRIFDPTKVDKPLDENEFREFMIEFNRRFMIWGADEVVAAWGKWRQYAVSGAAKTNPASMLFLYEGLIFAIRRDLGHKNKNLTQGDILSLFINDIDQILPPKR